MKIRSDGYVFPWYGDRSALVAHEDPQVRRYLKEALARAGYATYLSGDSDALLNRGHTDGHSFVILRSNDSSRDILRRLRAQGNPIPVILISGSAAEPQSPANPDVGYLSAPFTLESLQVAIAQVCHFD